MRNWCCVTYEFSFVYKSRRNPAIGHLCKCVSYTFSYTTHSCFLTSLSFSLPASAPPVSLLKRPGGGPQPWPIHPRPIGQVYRSHFPSPPHVSLFHTRHAEESAERPHLVTIVRPCAQSTLRKVNLQLYHVVKNLLIKIK